MKLAKVKTDKSDAKAICEYGIINEVPLYNALTDVKSECLQLFRLMDSCLKNGLRPRIKFMEKMF
jgi:transposase